MPDWKFYGKCAVCGVVGIACFCASTPKLTDMDCFRNDCVPRPTLHAAHDHPEQPFPQWPLQSRHTVAVTTSGSAVSLALPITIRFPPPQ